MTFRLNAERFANFPDWKLALAIEKFIDKSRAKYDRSNVPTTKAQALVEEAEGYYARNKLSTPDICTFNIYIQHWTEAHRGIIPDIYLDMVEREFGVLEGALHIPRGHCNWNTMADWRSEPIPQKEVK